MWKSVVALDRILRGESTRIDALREGRIEIPVAGLSVLIALLGMFYGSSARLSGIPI